MLRLVPIVRRRQPYFDHAYSHKRQNTVKDRKKQQRQTTDSD